MMNPVQNMTYRCQRLSSANKSKTEYNFRTTATLWFSIFAWFSGGLPYIISGLRSSPNITSASQIACHQMVSSGGAVTTDTFLLFIWKRKNFTNISANTLLLLVMMYKYVTIPVRHDQSQLQNKCAPYAIPWQNPPPKCPHFFNFYVRQHYDGIL